MEIPNFKFNKKGELSSLVQGTNIFEFRELCLFLEQLNYARISDPSDLSLIIKEQKGTCSTKHAFLKQVASEQKKDKIKLIVGIFKMNAKNTPIISDILSKNNLEYIPEAHCYLIHDSQRLDFTKPDVDVNSFLDDVIVEKEISPHQVGQWKKDFHKKFMEEELKNKKEWNHFSLDELWNIREECIEALS